MSSHIHALCENLYVFTNLPVTNAQRGFARPHDCLYAWCLVATLHNSFYAQFSQELQFFTNPSVLCL